MRDTPRGEIVAAIVLVFVALVSLWIYHTEPQSAMGSFMDNLISTWYGWIALAVIWYIVGFLVNVLVFLLGVIIKGKNQIDA